MLRLVRKKQEEGHKNIMCVKGNALKASQGLNGWGSQVKAVRLSFSAFECYILFWLTRACWHCSPILFRRYVFTRKCLSFPGKDDVWLHTEIPLSPQLWGSVAGFILPESFLWGDHSDLHINRICQAQFTRHTQIYTQPCLPASNSHAPDVSCTPHAFEP